ncbi:MAG: hypothetical protein U0W40_15425 [Acidimicrobiia bacterium]
MGHRAVPADAGASSVDELQALPIDKLLAAQEATVEAALPTIGMMPFHPGSTATCSPAGRTPPSSPHPLVVGTTAHEMELFRDQVPVLPEEFAGYPGCWAHRSASPTPQSPRRRSRPPTTIW